MAGCPSSASSARWGEFSATRSSETMGRQRSSGVALPPVSARSHRNEVPLAGQRLEVDARDAADLHAVEHQAAFEMDLTRRTREVGLAEIARGTVELEAELRAAARSGEP